MTDPAPAPTAPAWDADAFRARVQATLEEFLAEQEQRLAPLGADAASLLAEARTSVSGGKRLRASFCWWGFHAVAGAVAPADEEALLRACAAVEVLHASALVHDDYMDGSDTRRGRPATHVAYAARHRAEGWRGDPASYGAAAAILAGDLLLSWADELLRRCGLPADRVARALGLLDLTRSEVVAGQFLDVSAQARGGHDVDAAMRVVRYKSAKYSVERPLHLGATLAGADDATLATLTSVGLPLGEAFQLRDDLLGVFGDPGLTGKPAGDDLVEGKRTVLVALALQEAPPADAADLDAALGTPLTSEDVQRLRGVITASGAVGRVEDLIENLAGEARSALAAAAIDDRARAVLGELLRATTHRTT